MACFIGNNYIRPNGAQAAHSCGQASCVNPAHLRFATAVENAADKNIHGTHRRKLSWAQVLEVRNRYAKGETQVAIAKAFGVGRRMIVLITNNKTRMTE
jgi:hypothetical protein